MGLRTEALGHVSVLYLKWDIYNFCLNVEGRKQHEEQMAIQSLALKELSNKKKSIYICITYIHRYIHIFV